jgi:fumarate reductase subunit C
MKDVAIKAARRWYWQRITAMVMTVFVLVHVVAIVYAIHGGLSAAEVLGRTRGNMVWAMFYAAFVALVSVHASIGLRNILVEWTRAKESAASVLANSLGLLLLAMGLRAVWAVTWGGAA